MLLAMESGFTTTQWRKFGKHRTYVTDAHGAQIGYRDNLTGALIPESAETSPALHMWAAGLPEGTPQADAHQPVTAAEPEPENAADHRDGSAVVAGEAPDADCATAPASELLLPEDDLALNRPGQAARARAAEEWTVRRESRGAFWAWTGRVLDVNTDERAWRIGADAEQTVGAELERLTRHGWHVLHAVPIGSRGSDIDHVLIGPGGVVTVNAKHHPNAKVWVVAKQVRVNGQSQPYLRNSRFEAERASKLLTAAVGFPVHAIGCLIFRLREGSLTVKEEPGDVLVYQATKAYPAFRGEIGVLSTDEVDAIYAAARQRGTWV
jgi:hypothetical protein